MYKIAIYGSNKKVIDLYNAVQNDPNVTVAWVVDPKKNSVVRNSEIPERIIKEDLAELWPHRETIFAVVNVAEDPELWGKMEKAGLVNVKIISGSSAAFLYDREGSDVKQEDYKKIMYELSSMAKNMSMLFDKEKILNEILKGLCDQTKATRASILMYDRREKVLKVAMACGIDQMLWDVIRIPVGESIAGRVAETKKPILIKGTPDDSLFKRFMKREEIKAAMSVPLIKNGDVVGVLNLASQDNVNAFNDRDMEFVGEVSTIITEILFATRTFQEYKEDALRYELLSEVSDIIAEKAPLYDRLMKVVEYLKNRFGVFVAIALKSNDGSFETIATNFALWEQSDVFWENTTERYAFDNKKDVCFIDPDSKGFRGYLTMPLMEDEGACFGVMSLLNYGKAAQEKAGFFKLLAVQLSRLLALTFQKEMVAEESRQKDMMAGVLDGLSELVDPVTFGHTLLKSVAREIDAKIGILRMYDEEKNSYVVKDVVGIETILSKDFFQMDREVVKNMLVKNKSICVKNTRRNKEFSHFYPAIQSLFVYPLLSGDRVDMVFSFYNSGNKELGKTNVDIVSKLFSKAEGVLKNVRGKMPLNEDILMDTLTELPNFRYFEKRVFEEVLRSRRLEKRLVILIAEFRPYDKFLKAYGKSRADEIIKKIATQIRDRVRTYEVVARLNVSKFGIVLVDADEKALEVIFRLRKVYEKENWDPKGLIKEGVGLRFGYARFPEDGDEYDELIVKANHIR